MPPKTAENKARLESSAEMPERIVGVWAITTASADTPRSRLAPDVVAGGNAASASFQHAPTCVLRRVRRSAKLGMNDAGSVAPRALLDEQ
jgi:hypothetical protein